ncbi:calcium/sodium antiporter [Thermosulfuriphilus ammonigenes]|uniref:Calcium/sodium antiporter n=1 Tax=Thermosulfuriphilus ammonigenes TaxID=1936021 RepID=A0A6G7PUL0_9BACT|nr:calcium/sodium antiporter [Thermosulfuriphilus ammonigenes]MBA2848615.1 cation:H+ antiporter [Thermosulfuriphilus ammonigenes]QIJ71246.1 calcium/sodium antiporter [Thermosulfuriphilus ammonigenes]
MKEFLFLVGGFALLLSGGHFLVEGAAALAKRLRVSDRAIGLTVVAFGTSAPELLVNIIAAIKKSPDLAIGNILGSNIANILLILGASSLVYPLTIHLGTVWKEIPFSLLAVIVLFFMANDGLLDGLPSMISRSDGLVLLSFFAIFLFYAFGLDRREEIDYQVKPLPWGLALLMTTGGIIGLGLGGNMVVDGARGLVILLGVSQAFIGLTIVALGTSLPELVTSVVAAFKKKTEIAVGNVVGSNIFNIFWILGITASVSPIPFRASLNLDIGMVILATLALFVGLFLGRTHELDRKKGFLFLCMYFTYLAILALRER